MIENWIYIKELHFMLLNIIHPLYKAILGFVEKKYKKPLSGYRSMM